MALSVKKNTVWLTSSLIAQKVLSFVYFALIARALGVETTGIYVFALAFTALFGIFADFGITPVIIREVAKEKNHSQFSPDLSKLLVSSIKAKIVLIVISAVAAVGVVRLLGYEEQIIFLVLATTGVMALDAIHIFFYGILRGIQNLKFEALGMFVGQLLVISFGGYVLYKGWPVIFLILALGIGSAFNVANSLYYVKKRKIRIPWKAPLSMRQLKTLFYIAWPFAAAGILARGYAQIDIVLLKQLAGNVAVGLYAVPSKIVFAFQFIPIALAAALYPAMSRAYVQSREKLGRIVELSLMYLVVIVAPLLMILLVLGPLLIPYVFGFEYEPSVVVLQVLALSMVFGFADFPIGSLLNATHRQHLQTLSMFITLLTNLILNIMLIPRLGPMGAAISALAGQTVLFFTGLWFARDIIHWNLIRLIRRVGRILVSVVIAGAILHKYVPYVSEVLASYYQTQSFVQLFGALVTAILSLMAVYGLIALLLRGVYIDEIKQFLKAFKRT